MTAHPHTSTDSHTAEAPMSVPDPTTPDVSDLDDGELEAGVDGDELDVDDPFIDATAAVEDADIAGRSNALFEGDEGSLTFDQRRALVFILKHRYISAEQNPAEWAVLLSAQVPLRARLNDLFLDLHIDHDTQIAFKRQAVAEDDRRFPTLLHDMAHTREETILLVFLRERFRSERSGGADAVYVDRDELLETVERFRPPDANDRALDARRVENAITSLQRAGLLLKTGDDQRLRVAPVIEVLLPLARLHELLEGLWTLNGTGPAEERPGAENLELDFDAPGGPTDDHDNDLMGEDR